MELNNKHYSLKVFGRVAPSIIAELKSNANNSNFFFCDYSEYLIPLGSKFNYISNCDKEILYTGDFFLTDISQEFFMEMDSIPIGFKTIMCFKFIDNELPSSVNELNYLTNWEQHICRLIFSNYKLE